MGKLNLSTKNKKKKSASGIPNWLLTTIVTVIIAAVLLFCAYSVVDSTGLALRLGVAMKSDNYNVSANMMRYYYINTYSNFVDSYGTYLSYFSLGQNTPISEHDDIVFGGTSEDTATYYDTTFLGDFDGTWFDYFMSQTKDGVKTMLIYCEKANELGISLEDAEKAEIDASIDAAIEEFKKAQGISNVSESTCLGAMYGEGMNRGDIRKAMELSTLASKCQTKIYEQLEAGVTDDRVLAFYEANKDDFDLVDYFYYSFDVEYTDVAKELLSANYDEAELNANKDKVDAKYKEKIAEAKAAAAELATKTELADFKNYIYAYEGKSSYDTILNQNKPADNLMPTNEQMDTVKANLVANIVAEVIAGETAVKTDVVESGEGDAKTYTLYEMTITPDFAEAVKKMEASLFSVVKAVDDNYAVEKEGYDAESEFSKWAFAEGCQVGGVKLITEGDGSAEGEVTVDKKTHSSSVYYMTKTRYKNEENSKNVAYMMFAASDSKVAEENAKAAIEKLKAAGTLTTDSFATIATEAGAAAQTVYENYTEGSMQSATFDAWLYDDATTLGTYTQTPLMMGTGEYMVAFYAADGEPSWSVTVKNSILNEDFTAYSDNLTVAFGDTVVTTDWVVTWISKLD